jgi:hypothetical protein
MGIDSFYSAIDHSSLLHEHNFHTEWATQAGRLALQEVESPTEDHIVTFMNLALFWYGQGEWRRAIIHKGQQLLVASVCSHLH